MITAGLVFAGLAGLLHVYIFTMESLTWTSKRTRAAFGTTPEEADLARRRGVAGTRERRDRNRIAADRGERRFCLQQGGGGRCSGSTAAAGGH